MIKFGTSGFRGIIGDNFTKESVKKVAYAICELAKDENMKKPEVVIGYDNRFMSQDYAKWVGEVLSTTMKVKFYSISVPTPLVCFETKNMDFGIMITASHNPYNYNGIKVFLRGGRDCDDEKLRKIEKTANKVKVESIKSENFDDAIKSGKIVLANDIKKYCDSILNFVNIKTIQKSNIRVLVNAMHGNSTGCIKYLLNKLKNNLKINTKLS